MSFLIRLVIAEQDSEKYLNKEQNKQNASMVAVN